MKKVIKNWGNGLGIYFDQEDIKIYKLKEDDLYDLELVKIKSHTYKSMKSHKHKKRKNDKSIKSKNKKN
jgi:hypothetical protein